MNPRPEFVSLVTAMALGEHVVPHLPDGHYAMGNAAASAALMMFIAQDIDRGVPRRLAEIDRMKQLFKQGLELIGADGLVMDEALSQSLRAHQSIVPVTYAPSELDGLKASMLPALIDLHIWAEDHRDRGTAALEAAILSHLVVTADSRALQIPQ